MANGRFTCRCLNGGVKKGYLSVQRRRVKVNDCVRILSFPLDPGHVLLASEHIGSSTKELFNYSLIGTICILVIASAEVPIAHALQNKCVQLGSDPQYMKHLLMIFRYISML